jgi:hypothetical protein
LCSPNNWELKLRPTPTLEWFVTSLQTLCEHIRPPRRTIVNGKPSYRFDEQNIEAAILLKSARYISGLHAGQLLLDHGFLQELTSLERSIGDFEQDAIFLADACITGELTQLHTNFLTSFWEEHPDFEAYVNAQGGRPEVPRAKIQSYISRMANGGQSEHREIAAAKYLSRISSAFVHGHASALIDLYNPQTRQLEVRGVTSHWLRQDHRHNFENYFYRGVCLLAVVAKAIGNAKILQEANNLQQELKPHYTTKA